jgi:hypothetical protein
MVTDRVGGKRVEGELETGERRNACDERRKNAPQKQDH